MGWWILTGFSPISKGYEAKRLVKNIKPVSTVTVQSVCPHRKNIGRNVTLVVGDSQVSPEGETQLFRLIFLFKIINMFVR
ncbi:hypothetical protein QV09_00405 [Gallibacterium salpingitidis]|uniref:Uncharacterized protein n=1 Tax=Gallibacterium salpingitidis TaxID=505341 RepID=A0AB36E5P2_9PAST|nr:hypothetical protein QV09_00405 [Gallibacterium salpingitidis]